MEPDFYRLYQDLPVPDLVKVAKTPSEYLPEAVTAAERILRERGISREEISAEEWVIAQKEMSDGLKRGRLRDYTAWIGELFGSERLTQRSERWLTVLLLLYGIFYSYTMFVIIRQLAWLYRCTNCYSVPGSFLTRDLELAVYITVCLYCLLRQRWLGWSLLLIHVVFFLCKKLAILFHFYVHHDLFFGLFFTHLIPSLIYIGFGILLWRPYVMRTFKINAATRDRTLLVAALAGIVAMVIT